MSFKPQLGRRQPGEFTKLYQKALETVDIVFFDKIEKIEWKAFLASFLELRTQTGSDEISISA